MTPADTARVLAKAQAYDRRTVGEADVLAWHEAIGDLGLADSLEAVRRHFTTSTDWLMPAHIRVIVAAIREERRRGTSTALALPSRFEYSPERAEQVRAGITRCAAALAMARTSRPKAIEADEKPPPSPSDIIRERALGRARAERKTA